MAKREAQALANGYSAEVESMLPDAWDRLQSEFADAGLFQSFAGARGGQSTQAVSTLVLRRDGVVVAGAMVKLRRIPLLGGGYASVFRGPFWRRVGEAEDAEVFRQVVRALRNEYVCRRGMSLRVFPFGYVGMGTDQESILRDEGFVAQSQASEERTIVVDLMRSAEELRQGMSSHGRRKLRDAEKKQLHLEEGTEIELMDRFLAVFPEMQARKKFVEVIDVRDYRVMQAQLAESHRMRVVLASSEEGLCYGAIFTMLGEYAVYLFGATSNVGLKSSGSWAVHWRAMELMREQGVRWYDLGGIDAEKNPGTWRFKCDLAGTNGSEVVVPGGYDAVAGGFVQHAMEAAMQLRRKLKQWKYRLRALRLQKSSGAGES